eukprot:scaffold1648_cov115-Cylindrotheca_fusiformis.AAC.19
MKISSGREFYDDGYSDDEKEELENRLVFPQHRLYGRASEMGKLTSLYNSLGSQPVPPFVVVSGFRGAGKSTLVNNLARDLDDKAKQGIIEPLFFISGKYDQRNERSDLPFSAIVRALEKFLLQFLNEGSPDDIEKLRTSIQSAIGDEIQSLMTVVPILAKFMNKGGAQPHDHDIAPKTDAWNQFQYLFQSLIKAISSADFGRRTILFLDNMHLADETSLDLLSMFVRDKSMSHLMIICSIQCLLEKNHPCMQRLEALEEELEVERIEVNNLSLEDVNNFVADTLELASTETLPLSKVVYDQTRGNMFFAMTFLEELHRKKILFLSVISFRWEWKLEAAGELEAELSKDMLNLIVRKIRDVPETVQRMLVIASFTRSMLSVETMLALLDCDGGPCVDSVKEFTHQMDRAVNEGLLEKVENGNGCLCYRFAHDQIQQAAMSLVPPGQQREKLKVSIALRLIELADKHPEESWMLFVATSYLNATPSSKASSFCLANINLACGNKAFDIGAFHPASKYFRRGLRSLLELDTPWETHYDLALRLYRANSNVELCLGNFDACMDLSLVALRNCKSLEDKKPSYLTMSYAKGEQGRPAEALQICLDALWVSNDFPKRFQPLHMMTDLRKVRRYFEAHTDEDFLQIPPVANSVKRTTMELIATVSQRAYACNNMVQYFLGCLRVIRLSLEHGFTGRTAIALSGYAAYLSYSDSQNAAVRMGRLAVRMLEKVEDRKKAEPSIIFTVSNIIDCWNKPMEVILRSQHKAFKSAMECGNIEIAFLNRIGAFRYMLLSGYPLDAVAKFGAETLEQLGLYNAALTRSYMIECLMPLKHLQSGENKCDWGLWLNTSIEGSKDEKYQLLFHFLSRLFLGVMFGNLEFSKRISDKLAVHAQTDILHCNLVQRLFFSGLTYSRLARQSGKKKHLIRSRQFADKLRKLIYSKGTTPLHLLKLLDADILASSGRGRDEIQASYDIAIAMALETGHIQFAALGSEIAGEVFLRKGDESLGKRFMFDARALYKEWQAFAKVDDLVMKYSSIFNSERQEIVGSSHLVREIGNYQRRIPSDLAHLPADGLHEIPFLSIPPP